MACPFFMPTEQLQDGGWIHPARLPLGGGWHGHCCAPGHEGVRPETSELRECNLGYAATCTRLPSSRTSDAVRFGVSRDRGSQLDLFYVHELAHCPGEHGTLIYDVGLGQWLSSHSQPHIQKMAYCYLQSYLLRRIRPAVPATSTSANS